MRATITGQAYKQEIKHASFCSKMNHKCAQQAEKMNLGENIKLKRERLGMSRAELVEKSGVSTAQMSRIERGEQKNPNLETLVAISTALNSSIDEIVFGEESASSTYLGHVIENLPSEKRSFIKEMIKLTVMSTSSEELEKNFKQVYSGIPELVGV